MYFSLFPAPVWLQWHSLFWDCRSTCQLSICKVVGYHRSKTWFAFLFSCLQMASLSSLRTVVSQNFLSGVFRISSLGGRNSGEWGKSKFKRQLIPYLCSGCISFTPLALLQSVLWKSDEGARETSDCNITTNNVSHTRSLRCVRTRGTICTFFSLSHGET